MLLVEQALLVGTSGACIEGMRNPSAPTLNLDASPAAKRWARLIWRRRLEAGLSQSQLAELLDIAQQKVSAWERAEYEPNLQAQADLVRTLGIHAADIEASVFDAEGAA